MARTRKTAIVAQETTPAAAEIVEQVAAAYTMPGDAAEPLAPDTSFTPHEASGRNATTQGSERTLPRPHMVWARIDGSADKPIGIKLETEQERKAGMLHQRVLIRFRDDLLPTADEKARLKAEGFKFCPDVQAWGMQKSAANQVLALRTVNDLMKGRGHTGQGLYV